MTLHSAIVSAVVVLVVSASGLRGALGQEPEADHPLAAEIAALEEIGDASQFIASAQQLREAASESALSEEELLAVDTAVRTKSNSLLETDQVFQGVTEADLLRLIRWAAPLLSDEEKQGLEQRVDAGRQPFSQLSFDEMRWRYWTEGILSGHLKSLSFDSGQPRREKLADWVQARGVTDLTDHELVWTYDRLRRGLPLDVDQLEIVWTGELVPPRDGEYTFSPTELRLTDETFRDPIHHCRQSMKVVINGATAFDWGGAGPLESSAIRLNSGQQATLEVTFRYERNRDWPYPPTAAALLYWDGPGFPKGLVPASALKTATDGEEGLNASYSWNRGEERGAAQTVDSTIESSWVHYISIGVDRALITSLAEEMLERLQTNGELVFPNRWNPDSPFRRRWAGRWGVTTTKNKDRVGRFLSDLSCQRRAEALDWIRARPDHLVTIKHATDLLYLYHAARPGCEEAALDLAGAWMGANRDLAPVLRRGRNGFWQANRNAFRELAIYLAGEHPESVQRLEDGYLESDEGECCLPAAYTLAYCYLINGELSDWIAQLDARLEGETLSGDARVNWLLARAMAQEVKGSPAERHVRGSERLLAGMAWLDEAVLVSQSVDTERRVQMERVCRLASMGDYDRAEAALNEMSGDMSKQLTKIDNFRQKAAEAAVQREAEAQQAYLAELARRRDNAGERGDDASQQRYAAQIERLSSEQ